MSLLLQLSCFHHLDTLAAWPGKDCSFHAIRILKGIALVPRISASDLLAYLAERSLSRHACAQLLPLRVDLENNPTFAELVKLNASKSKEICQHSEVSVAQLAQAVGADKFDFTLGLHPVFQAAYLLDACEEARRLSQGFK